MNWRIHFFYAWLLGTVLFILGCFAVHGQEWHDPALDTINVNLGYLDADLNGNFYVLNSNVANLPSNTVAYGMGQGYQKTKTNLNPILAQAGVPSIADSSAVIYGGSTNNGALSNGINAFFSSMRTNVGNIAGMSGNGQIVDLTALTSSNSSLVLQVPVIAGTGPAGSSMGGGRWFTESVEMQIGSLGAWSSPSFARGVRFAILGFTIIVYFYGFVDAVKKNAGEAMAQRQMQGSTQSFAGINSSALTSVNYSYIVTGLILTFVGALITAGVSSILGDFSSAANSGGSGSSIGGMARWQSQTFDFLKSIPFWLTITEFIPMWNIVLLYIYYRFAVSFLIHPVFMAVRCITLWFPA